MFFLKEKSVYRAHRIGQKWLALLLDVLSNRILILEGVIINMDICRLVVRVPDYRSRGRGFDSRRYHVFLKVLGLERGPLSLVRITEELLEWKSGGFGSRKSRLTAVGSPLR
jgi:hypothetical protein